MFNYIADNKHIEMDTFCNCFGRQSYTRLLLFIAVTFVQHLLKKRLHEGSLPRNNRKKPFAMNPIDL